MIRIAITKGRIEKDVCEIFKKAGIPVEDIINKDRKLLIKSKINDMDVEYVFVKSSDVITLIKYGKVDIGFVGKDTLSENRFKEYYELLDLNIGKCYFALASYPEYEDKKYKDKKIIATKYPNIAKNFFNKKGEEVEIVKLNGSVELGPVVSMSDAIVDLVETGDTLRANGLKVFEKIEDISTRMIVNKSSLRQKNNEIFNIVDELERVI